MAKRREFGRPRRSKPRTTPLYAWWESLSAEMTARPLPDELALRFGCSKSTIYGLLDGSRVPSLELATTIEARTNGAVPTSAWIKKRARGAS